jgi:hypothetical protein
METFKLTGAKVELTLGYELTGQRDYPLAGVTFRADEVLIVLVDRRLISVTVLGVRLRKDGSDGAATRQSYTHMHRPAWLEEIVVDALSRWDMYTSRAADS